jgi:hypothetical protein
VDKILLGNLCQLCAAYQQTQCAQKVKSSHNLKFNALTNANLKIKIIYKVLL